MDRLYIRCEVSSPLPDQLPPYLLKNRRLWKQLICAVFLHQSMVLIGPPKVELTCVVS